MALAALATDGFAADKHGASSPSAPGTAYWAYPSGVLVSDDGLVGSIKEEPDAVRTINATTTAFEDDVSDCVKKMRDDQPNLARAGANYSFIVSFDIGTDGRAHDATLRPGAASADLPPCIRAASERYSTLTVKLRPPARPKRGPLKGAPKAAFSESTTEFERHLYATVAFRALILTDEEAKGRGFLYYQAEKEWEKKLRENREWFRCESPEDCALVIIQCEIRAVNAKHQTEFLEAAAKRRRPTCLEPDAPEAARPTCSSHLCGKEMFR